MKGKGVAAGALRQAARRLDMIARVTGRVVAAVSLADQMRETAEQVRDAFGVDVCVIRALEADDRLHLRAAVGLPEGLVYDSLPAGYGIALELISRRKALAIADVPLHPSSVGPGRSDPQGYKFRSYAGAPLLVEDRVVGILGIYLHEERREFSVADLEHLQIVANHVAIALENDRLYRAVEAQQKEIQVQAAERERLLRDALGRAERDPLTGAYNHQTFHNRLEQEAQAVRRGERPGFAVVLLDLDDFRLFNETYGYDAGDGLLRLIADALRAGCRPGDVLARVGPDEFALLLPGVCDAALPVVAARLEESVRHLGYRPPGYPVEIPLRLAVGAALFPAEAPTVGETLHLADERLRRCKRGESDALSGAARAHLADAVDGFSMLDGLVTAVDNKDRYTRRHSEEVFRYALRIAQEMGMSARETEELKTAALLHDVGKIGVPDRLLRLPTRLSDEESAAMRQHPALGALLVAAVPALAHLVPAIRHHHERWDGGGYPDGLAGPDIPLHARILAVADTFSAMTTDRPYRRGLPPDAALRELEAGAGTQWDPDCVAAFVRAWRLWEAGITPAGAALPLSKFSP